jgi:hypothetical protein
MLISSLPAASMRVACWPRLDHQQLGAGLAHALFQRLQVVAPPRLRSAGVLDVLQLGVLALDLHRGARADGESRTHFGLPSGPDAVPATFFAARIGTRATCRMVCWSLADCQCATFRCASSSIGGFAIMKPVRSP